MLWARCPLGLVCNAADNPAIFWPSRGALLVFFFFLRCLFLLLPFANVSVMFFFLKKKIVHFVISL